MGHSTPGSWQKQQRCTRFHVVPPLEGIHDWRANARTFSIRACSASRVSNSSPVIPLATSFHSM